MTRRLATIACMLVSLTATLGSAYGEDLKLKDGSVYREVRVVEVRPDALIVEHKSGVAMASFDQLPPAIRKRYHYDPIKASEYRSKREAARKATAEENRRLIAAHEQRKLALASAQAEAALAKTAGTELIYIPGTGDREFERGVTGIAAEIAQFQAARDAEELSGDTFWTASFWKHPVVQFIGMLLGGYSSGGGSSGGFSSEPRNWR